MVFIISHEAPKMKFLPDERDFFLRTGGTLELTCTLQSVASVEMITWYRENSLIESDQTRYEMTRQGSTPKENCVIETRFQLRFENVSLTDSGTYACASSYYSHIKPAQINVEIIDPKGERFIYPINIKLI